MATNQALSGGNLGTVLETYGGKSLKRIVAVGAAVFGCGLTAALLIHWFRPDYPILADVFFGAGLVIALIYGTMNLAATLAKVEVCEGGVRLLRRAGGSTELPWDRILKVKVGAFTNVRGGPVENVVIRTTEGQDIEFPFGFWAAVGTERFAATLHRFVEDVEEDVEFIRPRWGTATVNQDVVFGVWFGVVWPPCFFGIFVGMAFAFRADGPAWKIWVGRAVLALFGWLVSFLWAGFDFRELQRRGGWGPPGATRRPWLAAAVYAAVMLFISTVVIVGLVVLLELLCGTQGRTNG
jgi:hypothetical protein